MSDAEPVAAPSRFPTRAGIRGAPRPARSGRLEAAAALGVAAILPLFLSQGSTALETMVEAAAYVIMALGLNVVVGFAGLLDLGYVAFFAIGAHVTAYLGSAYWADAAGGNGIHVNFLIILVAAVLATTTVGVLIGIPTTRLRGTYVGIVTLAFGEVIGQVAYNGQDIHVFGGSLTAGPNGITPIDSIDLPFLKPFGPLDLRPWYWFALALVALMLVANVRLRDSRLGRAWIALRDAEEAAAAAGVPIARTKLQAYGAGAALGGASGAFLASYLRTVNPSQFTFSFSIFILVMVVLGGMGSIRGVVAGAIALTALNNYLLPRVFDTLPSEFGLDFDLSAISSGIYGFVLLIVVLLRPEGLLPERGRGRMAP